MTSVVRRFVAMAVLVGVVMATTVTPVAAADPVTFGHPGASSSYGVSLAFEQPVELAAAPTRVELLLRTPGAVGPNVTEVDPPTSGGSQTLRFAVVLADGHIVPNTTFIARWRVTTADGKTWLGPEITHTYDDDRVTWHSLEGDLVRVHWYEGSDAFGRRALDIGDKAVAETSELLGVTETDPIDFYIYADQDEFYDALGPGTRENVGGEAHSDIRTLFALIAPSDINDSWIEVVVPHELTHLVFATAVDNPYHEPPHWLNEGLAVYLSEGYTSSDRNMVEGVAGDGTIIPLAALAGAFPTTRDRFFLGYAESVSAVDHIISTYGQDDLIKLIRSYGTGLSDDEAFKAALGVDTAAFEKEWLDAIGAVTPVRHGPQPGLPGPLPDGWSGAAPNPSIEPGAPATSAPSGRPAVGAPGSDSGFGLVLAILIVIVVGSAGSLVLFGRRPKPAGADGAEAAVPPAQPAPYVPPEESPDLPTSAPPPDPPSASDP